MFKKKLKMIIPREFPIYGWLFRTQHFSRSDARLVWEDNSEFRPFQVGHLRTVYCKVAGSNLTCGDDWKTRWRLHSVDLTLTGISSPGQNVIHSPVARVVYGWWALVYKLIRMPGSIGYVANCAIWRLRGSLDKNACSSSLSQAFRLVWLYKCSLK